MHDTLKNISEIKIKRTIIIKATISAWKYTTTTTTSDNMPSNGSLL
jgi:hypothetical protein